MNVTICNSIYFNQSHHKCFRIAGHPGPHWASDNTIYWTSSMEKLQPPKAPQVPSAAPLVTVADLFNAVSKQGEIDKLTNHIKELESQVQDLTGELRDVQDELETSRHREEIYRLENEVREALSDIK